jgi:Tfp pilus assembly PilM family ATPase
MSKNKGETRGHKIGVEIDRHAIDVLELAKVVDKIQTLIELQRLSKV